MKGNRRLAISLAVLLFILKLSRAQAQEDTAGYRHEWYDEDKDRIKVNTDTYDFDVALGPKVRATGQLVFDTISGATPTGAPPQTQWPFPTYNQIYQSAYPQAYNAQFNQFIADNLVYAINGLESFTDVTNGATAFAQSTAGTVATNNANVQYSALTNNPNFHNKSVPLTPMHDFRVGFSLGTPITFKRDELTPSIAFSAESDYVSRGIALNDSHYFNNKNTTLNVGWSGNFDIVRDDTRINWQRKTTHDFLAGVTQLLTPKSYVTANLTFGTETGYLSDPYRSVMFLLNFPQTNPNDAALLPEQRPRHRTREIVYLGYTHFIDPLNGSAEVSYRFFHDSWQVNAHTLDLRWNQKIGKRFVVSPLFRYYYQTAASFYYVLVPDFDHRPAAFSSDYRLSELNTFSLGLKATYRIQKHLSLEAGYMRYVMRGLDGITSETAYPTANVFTLGLRGWF